jgi:hypothetical protein
LLLLPFLRRKPEPIPTPEPLPDIIPEPLPFSNIPQNPESGEYWMARFRSLEDLFNGFDNQENVANGINYRAICEELEGNFDRFATDEDRITWICHHILDQWMTYDAKKLGVDRVTLNYKNDAHQLMHAQLHALEILEAVEDKMSPDRTTDNYDYVDTIQGNYGESYNQIADAVIHPSQQP